MSHLRATDPVILFNNTALSKLASLSVISLYKTKIFLNSGLSIMNPLVFTTYRNNAIKFFLLTIIGRNLKLILGTSII
jgi:hypothetical protein